MQTLQIACHNSPSPCHPLILALSLSVSLSIEHLLTQKIKAHADEAPTRTFERELQQVLMCPSAGGCGRWKFKRSRHHGIFNRYYKTDSSGSQGVEVVERTAFSFQLSNLVQHILSVRLRCLGGGGGGAVWHRVATCWDFFFFVRRILVVYGQFKKINKSNKSYEIEHPALSEWKNQDTAPLCIWITWLHKQVHATSIRIIPHLFCLLTDYRER